MTVTFFSNFLTLHQTAFCEAMVKLIGAGFRFVATEPIPQERLDMGYENLSQSASYAIEAYKDNGSEAEALRLGADSDVVIIGSAPDYFIAQRLNEGKLTFRYYERFFKQGRWRILDPRVVKAYYGSHIRYRNKPLYMLCASAYTAPDCRFIHSYHGKTYKWGYFPEVKEYDEDALMAGKRNGKPSILWVGRQIDFKHPEYTVLLADALKHKGFDFTFTIVGEGPMRHRLEVDVQKRGLEDLVTFKNFMPQNQVRHHMEQANIFIFTSNQQEGWGAVLNEAMNSGCAVVANDQIGSVPFLIRDGENGLTYHKTVQGLISQVEKLIANPALTNQLGLEAYRTMRTVWNADVAAERLLQLIESINTGNELNIEYGPISKA